MKNSGFFCRLFFSLLVFSTLTLTSCVKSGDLLIQKGSSYYQRGNFEGAEELYTMALDADSTFSKEDIYSLIANCRLELGDYDTAIEWRNKILESREDSDNYINLGLLYRLKEDDETAEKMYKDALRVGPKDPAAYGSLGSLYLSQERIDEAIPNFQESASLYAWNGQVHANLAICYGKKSLFDLAEESMANALYLKLENYDDFRAQLDALEKEANYTR